MDTDATFWTEIDRAARRRRIRWATLALTVAATLGGSMGCASPDAGIARAAAAVAALATGTIG